MVPLLRWMIGIFLVGPGVKLRGALVDCQGSAESRRNSASTAAIPDTSDSVGRRTRSALRSRSCHRSSCCAPTSRSRNPGSTRTEFGACMMLPHIRLRGGTPDHPCDHTHPAPDHRISSRLPAQGHRTDFAPGKIRCRVGRGIDPRALVSGLSPRIHHHLRARSRSGIRDREGECRSARPAVRPGPGHRPPSIARRRKAFRSKPAEVGEGFEHLGHRRCHSSCIGLPHLAALPLLELSGGGG